MTPRLRFTSRVALSLCSRYPPPTVAGTVFEGGNLRTPGEVVPFTKHHREVAGSRSLPPHGHSPRVAMAHGDRGDGARPIKTTMRCRDRTTRSRPVPDLPTTARPHKRAARLPFERAGPCERGYQNSYKSGTKMMALLAVLKAVEKLQMMKCKMSLHRSSSFTPHHHPKPIS